MVESFVFSGFGAAFPPHTITNGDLSQLIRSGVLRGIDDERIRARPDFSGEASTLSPFEFFAQEMMGFGERHHVAPYPAQPSRRAGSDEVAELTASAVEDALNDASIDARQVGAWVIASASVLEVPGIAPRVKGYFAGAENDSPTRSIMSACGSFPQLVQCGLELLKANPRMEHVVLAHGETMSRFLANSSDALRAAVFGDGAGAVVLSRVMTPQACGVQALSVHQDLRFMGHLGADRQLDLYHRPERIKPLAVSTMLRACREVLESARIRLDDIALFVPHQTGNAIIDQLAEDLGVPGEKVFKGVQHRFGNISGATLPAALWRLDREARLASGDLVLATTTGVGGEYGALLYRVPPRGERKPAAPVLAGQVALVTGASGAVGGALASALADAGVRLVLPCRSDESARRLRRQFGPAEERAMVVLADFRDTCSVERLAKEIAERAPPIDHLLHFAAAPGPLARSTEVSPAVLQELLQVNCIAPSVLTSELFRRGRLKRTVVYAGSAAEDYQLAGSGAYVASKRALHGWAASASSEYARSGVRSIYYQMGVVDGGMAKLLDARQTAAALSLFQQDKPLELKALAQRIVRSLHCQKVNGVSDCMENALVVRRDAYRVEGVSLPYP
jgi:3-oxoacyl-[acyl-carrier-protein] synthase-3